MHEENNIGKVLTFVRSCWFNVIFKYTSTCIVCITETDYTVIVSVFTLPSFYNNVSKDQKYRNIFYTLNK